MAVDDDEAKYSKATASEYFQYRNGNNAIFVMARCQNYLSKKAERAIYKIS